MVQVKICGITRSEDALLAAQLGATAVGFVFWPGSRRYIDPYRARQIVLQLPPLVTAVGVFVDQPFSFVHQVAGLVQLGAVQLHGMEAPETYRGSRHRVIKALTIDRDVQPERLAEIPFGVTLLLDSHDPVTIGGTGRTIDWDVAARVAAIRRVILSGGLTAENVTSAIARVKPYGVDVSSGVEATPGIKDTERLRAFMKAVSEAPRVRAGVSREP